MTGFDSSTKGSPTERELDIYQEVKKRFETVTTNHSGTYDSFEKCKDPGERENLAKTIQTLEEAIIYSVADDFNLTFDEVARIYFKVDLFESGPTMLV